MTVTSMSSQYLLDNQISKSVLDRTSSWIQQIALKESQDSFCVEESNKKQDKLLIPAFYASLFTEQDDIEDNRIDLNYKKLSPVQQELDLLRAAQQGLRSHVISSVLHSLVNNKLENPGTTNNDANINGDLNQNGSAREVDINENMETHEVKEEEVIDGKIPKELLQELISSLANQDFFQGLGVLLTMLDPENLEDFLISLPQTKPSINLSIVFISFLIHIENAKEDLENLDKFSPKDVVLSALKDGKNSVLFNTLSKFLEIAADHNQAGVLSSLTGDIDVSRFSRDQQYKEDTILGLARSLEDSNWEFTCSLASRYNVDPWIVTATHMEAVLVETEDAHTITDMIKKQDLVSALQQDGVRWKEWSNQKIYPLLDGSNLEKLQLYYETMHEITLDQLYAQHSSVVTTLVDNDITIDYFSLLSGDRKVLKFITTNNIEIVAEAIASIPESVGARLLPADAYLYLANLEYNRRGKESRNWVDACTKCKDILEKLDAASLRLFCIDAILSEESITNISRSARIRIIKKLITLVEVKIALKAPDDWANLLIWQQELKKHVESFQSQLTTTILEDFPAKSTQLIVELENAGKSTQDILEFFVDVLGNHTTADIISKLIVIWKQNESKIDEAYDEIFNHCVESLLDAEEIKPDNLMPQCLQYLIEELEVRTENARNQLMPLCTLEKMPVAHRLMFVQLVKKTGSSESETKQGDERDNDMFDSTFLAEMYEVEARLQDLIPGLRITDQDLVNEDAKAALIQRIGQEVQDLTVMTKLSDFTSEFLSSNPTLKKKCLNQLIDYGLQLKQSKDEISHFIVKISTGLEKNDIDRVLTKCLDIDKEIYVKLVCELKIENKFTEIIQIIQELESVDDSTLTSVIHAGLGADLASTQLFVRMMEVAISEEIADKLVDQLKEGGYRAQACSLQLMALRIPGALRTMAAFKL